MPQKAKTTSKSASKQPTVPPAAGGASDLSTEPGPSKSDNPKTDPDNPTTQEAPQTEEAWHWWKEAALKNNPRIKQAFIHVSNAVDMQKIIESLVDDYNFYEMHEPCTPPDPEVWGNGTAWADEAHRCWLEFIGKIINAQDIIEQLDPVARGRLRCILRDCVEYASYHEDMMNDLLFYSFTPVRFVQDERDLPPEETPYFDHTLY